MERDKHVDESWKESVAKEKDSGLQENPAESGDDLPPEVNFMNYISSLAFQSLIFLGEMVHPMTQKIEENIPQAKFLIDTLIMLRDKTKNNLTPEEADLLNASVYELQVKFVERSKRNLNP